jgi:hypothetical protein
VSGPPEDGDNLLGMEIDFCEHVGGPAYLQAHEVTLGDDCVVLDAVRQPVPPLSSCVRKQTKLSEKLHLVEVNSM